MPGFDPFSCPTTSDTLTAIPAGTCEPDLEQTIGFWFQTTQASYSLTTTTALLLTNWSAALAATDATRIVKSLIINNPVIPPSEGNFEGGNDNTTVGGVRLYKGENAVTVTFMLRTKKKDAVSAMRELIPFANPAGSSTLRVFLVGRNKRLTGQVVSGKFIPILIDSFRISSVGSQGFNSYNTYECSFELAAGWDATLKTLVPTDFDPATYLVAA